VRMFITGSVLLRSPLLWQCGGLSVLPSVGETKIWR
jgi:hypothetical protein